MLNEIHSVAVIPQVPLLPFTLTLPRACGLPLVLLSGCLGAGLMAESPEGATESSEPVKIRVEDTGARIWIAEVKLSIGDLVLEEGEAKLLAGDYAIEVPMRSSKNESGRMELPLEDSLAIYMREGGTLVGRGFSDQRPEARRDIVCRIIPDADRWGTGAIELEIDTGERIMSFDTTYRVVGELPDRDVALQSGSGAAVGEPAS